MVFQIIVTVIYLLILGWLTYSGYKGTKNASDYLLAGRQIHPIIMALSYGATFISTSAIVGFGGQAGMFGMSLLWLTFLNIFAGVFIAFVFFGKRTRKMGRNLDAHTFPELLGLRFNSRFIQAFAAIVIFLFMPIYTAAVLKGAVNFLSAQFGINYNTTLFFFVILMAVYVSMGGLKGVMYSDAFQGIIMFGGMAFLLIFVYSKLGGMAEAHTRLTDLYRQPEVMEQTQSMAANGFRGWTSMPAFNSPYWWSIVSSIVLGVGIGVLAQPQLAVRFMTVKSNRELNRAVVSGGVFILFATGVAFTVGALSNVFFFDDTRQTALTASGAGGIDGIIPLFLKTYLPDWFGTVFMLVLLSAAMSTLSSLFHAVGTSFGRDFFEKGLGIRNKSVLLTRAGVLVAIVVTAVLAYVGNEVDATFGMIAQSTSVFFGLCAASFLPTYFASLYIRSVSKVAAISSVVTGAFVSVLWLFFFHGKNATVIGLCVRIFGKNHLFAGTSLEKLSQVDSILIALPISIIVLAVVGLATKRKPGLEQSHIDKCFYGVK